MPVVPRECKHLTMAPQLSSYEFVCADLLCHLGGVLGLKGLVSAMRTTANSKQSGTRTLHTECEGIHFPFSQDVY